MHFCRHVLIVDSKPDEVREEFKLVFPSENWCVYFASSIEEAKKVFLEQYSIDILIVGHDLGESMGVAFLEYVRELDENVALFLMDDDPRDTFSAYDAHRFKALNYFIHKEELKANPEECCLQLMRQYDEYIARLCTPRLFAEADNLRVVLVHEPSDEIDRIDPDNLPYYLFESLPSKHLMQEQHRNFVRRIKEMGRRPLVLDIKLLLKDIIHNSSGDERRSIVENILFSDDTLRIIDRVRRQDMTYSPMMSEKISDLVKMDSKSITDILMNGINIADFLGGEDNGSMYSRQECQIIEPTPNMYFMRDPGFVLGETFFISRMFRKIRRRETNIMREVIYRHPHMRGIRSNSYDLDEKTQDAISIEGGDTMCIAPGNYAIAESERTSRAAIRKVAEHLFSTNAAERLYQPLIPPKRAYIHLDTVCSLLGESAAVVHNEAFRAYSETLLWTPEVVKNKSEPISLGINFIDVLKFEFKKELVQAAGGGHRARIEQFDDATNVFMVNPQTPMVYDRNTETNRILEELGYKVGTFAGSDLVMGRGGARCMTMPIHRE
jgi:arginine deiminase